jgi:hypothetical protein
MDIRLYFADRSTDLKDCAFGSVDLSALALYLSKRCG